MARQHIYTVLSSSPNKWDIVKMDRDYDPLETYVVQRVIFEIGSSNERHEMLLCTCFAGTKDTCRHRQMLKVFEEADAINSRRAFDFDRHRWIEPLKPMETI